MPAYPFVTVDVFTDRRFGGNPLAVFPDARGLSDGDMQALAAEFNLSETTFVLPPEDPANTARAPHLQPHDGDALRGAPERGHRLRAGAAGARPGRRAAVRGDRRAWWRCAWTGTRRASRGCDHRGAAAALARAGDAGGDGGALDGIDAASGGGVARVRASMAKPFSSRRCRRGVGRADARPRRLPPRSASGGGERAGGAAPLRRRGSGSARGCSRRARRGGGTGRRGSANVALAGCCMSLTGDAEGRYEVTQGWRWGGRAAGSDGPASGGRVRATVGGRAACRCAGRAEVDGGRQSSATRQGVVMIARSAARCRTSPRDVERHASAVAFRRRHPVADHLDHVEEVHASHAGRRRGARVGAGGPVWWAIASATPASAASNSPSRRGRR
jgi:trans-2,3-dihydro-3-hydroxyanthranilate isomerase